MCAALKGHAGCSRLLLDAGADKNATDKVRVVAGCGDDGLIDSICSL
jgi:hypothetical protein